MSVRSHAAAPARTPIVLLDRHGFGFYNDGCGRGIIPAGRYAVRLVTDIAMVDEARGPELEAVVGVARDDAETYAEAARFLCSLGGRPATRIIAVAERLLLPAARLREELGLAGPHVEETLVFRDKVLMKQHLRARGIRVPDFASFTEAAARDLLRTHPAVVVKPRLGAGSQSVSVLRDAAELAACNADPSFAPSEFEVEEYVEGPLFHVDSVVREATVVAATAGRYLDATTSYRTVRRCSSVAVPHGELLEELLAFNRRVIACHPGFTGVTHHEIFLCERGPCHCEIAARAGGAGIVRGFLSRTGVNLHHVAVEAQLRRAVPASLEVAPHLTGWVLINAGPGVLLEPVGLPNDPWVLEARAYAEPGTVLPEPSSCGDGVALISVRGNTEAEVIDRLDEVVRAAAPKVATHV